jgi:hypothetical protein
MALPHIYEGTAQEIAEQLRGSNLTGKLKAIITPDEYETASTNGTDETLDKALASLLEEADRVEHEIPVPLTDSHEIAFGEIMAEKYRKMGFKV